MGQGDPPYEVMRLRVCEKMHWTFDEFDRQKASDVLVALEVWRLDSMSH